MCIGIITLIRFSFQRYLERFEYANAKTEDLWTVLGEVWAYRAVSNWVEQIPAQSHQNNCSWNPFLINESIDWDFGNILMPNTLIVMLPFHPWQMKTMIQFWATSYLKVASDQGRQKISSFIFLTFWPRKQNEFFLGIVRNFEQSEVIRKNLTSLFPHIFRKAVFREDALMLNTWWTRGHFKWVTL